LLCNFLCAGSSLLFGDADDGCQGKSMLLSAGFHTGAYRKRRIAEGGLHLQGEVNVLDRRVKCFRKHVLSFEEPSASHPSNF
jgi:hypothetical protein